MLVGLGLGYRRWTLAISERLGILITAGIAICGSSPLALSPIVGPPAKTGCAGLDDTVFGLLRC